MAESEKYIVTVDEKEHELSIEPCGDGFVVVNESSEFNIKAEKLPDGGFLVQFGASLEEIMINPNGGSLQVFVGGQQFDARVETQSLAELRKKAGAASGGVKDKIIKAPMPGLVLGVEVMPGDEIKKDQTLVIIEAMKMENMIKTISAGKVKKVYVETGQAVEKNDKLVELE